WGDQSAFLPGAVGNENLGPERTKETELGFDLAMFGDRLTTEFTAYFQTTTDALVAVQRAPSSGFLSRQLENVGTFKNRGLEIGINANLLETDRFGWDVGLNLATNANKVVDLGGAPQFSLGA